MVDFSESKTFSQDKFVNNILNKTEGFFLEIGLVEPQENNNTYVLEKQLKWKGINIHGIKPLFNPRRGNNAYINKWKEDYKKLRPNTEIVIDDTRFTNIDTILKKNNAPKNIDFLFLGLVEFNSFTLSTLENLIKTIFNNYKFRICIIRHDFYKGNKKNTRELSRELLSNKGYELLFPDVTKEGLEVRKSKGLIGNDPYEDWYVFPELVESDIVTKFKRSVNTKIEVGNEEGGLNHKDIEELTRRR